jgi:hypothetical protein
VSQGRYFLSFARCTSKPTAEGRVKIGHVRSMVKWMTTSITCLLSRRKIGSCGKKVDVMMTAEGRLGY